MEMIMTDLGTRTACVGVICFKGEQVLLIQRGTAPRKGEWSIPGGRIEPGESEAAAAARELLEETAITAKIGPKIIALPATFEGQDYLLHDFLAEWVSGVPQAGDDAAQARFVPIDQIGPLGLWDKTEAVIHAAYAKRASLSGQAR